MANKREFSVIHEFVMMKFVRLGGFAAYAVHMKVMKPIAKAKMNKVKRIYYENVSNNNANRILYTCYSSV
jgi:hypothetical protein